MKRKETEATILLRQHIAETNYAACQEWRFHDCRMWRFDFAFPCFKVAVEIEGGIYINGRHTRGEGFTADMEKYNHAALLGWRVLRFTPQQVLKGDAIEFIKRVLES